MSVYLKTFNSLILAFTFVISANAEELPLSYDNNNSFIATYLNFAFKPEKASPGISPYEARINPEMQHHLTDGYYYGNIELSPDLLHFTVKNKSTQIADVFVIPSSKITTFNVKNINEEFTGILEIPELNGIIQTKDLLLPISSECMDYRISSARINSTVFTHLLCHSRNLQLFINRPDKRVAIDQPFNAKITNNVQEKPKDVARHLIFIKYLMPESLDYKKPFNTLTQIPIPTNAIEYYLNAENSGISTQELKNNLLNLFNEDYKVLQQHAEEKWKTALLNTEYMQLDYKTTFEQLSITHNVQNNPILLVNNEQNYFSGSLSVYASSNNKIMASSAMLLPILVKSKDLHELSTNIAKDKTCVSLDDPSPISNWQMKGERVDCSVGFGLNNLKKTYLLYRYPSFNKLENAQEQPLLAIMLLGNAQETDIDDIVFNIELTDGIIWNLDTDNLSGFELKKILEAPYAMEWFTISEGNNLDLSKPWGKFLSRIKEQLLSDLNHTPEHVMIVIKAVAENLYQEIESIKTLENTEK